MLDWDTVIEALKRMGDKVREEAENTRHLKVLKSESMQMEK